MIEGDQLAPKLVGGARRRRLRGDLDRRQRPDRCQRHRHYLAQRFDAAGTEVRRGNPACRPAPPAIRARAASAAIANGGFLVSWTGQRGQPRPSARCLSAEAARRLARRCLLEDRIAVSEIRSGHRRFPAAVSPPSALSGYGQVYDAAGAKVGAAFDASGAVGPSTAPRPPPRRRRLLRRGRPHVRAPDRHFGARIVRRGGLQIGSITLLDTPASSHESRCHRRARRRRLSASDDLARRRQPDLRASSWPPTAPRSAARSRSPRISTGSISGGGSPAAPTAVRHRLDRGVDRNAPKPGLHRDLRRGGIPDGTDFLVAARRPTQPQPESRPVQPLSCWRQGNLVESPGTAPARATKGRRAESIQNIRRRHPASQIFGEVETPALDVVISTDSVNEIAVGENAAVLLLEHRAGRGQHRPQLYADRQFDPAAPSASRATLWSSPTSCCSITSSSPASAGHHPRDRHQRQFVRRDLRADRDRRGRRAPPGRERRDPGSATPPTGTRARPTSPLWPRAAMS